MADYITRSTDSLSGQIYLSIGTGVSNTLIDSYIDKSNKLYYSFDLGSVDGVIPPNIDITLTNGDSFDSILAYVKDLLFEIYVDGTAYFKGYMVKPTYVYIRPGKKVKFTIAQLDYTDHHSTVYGTYGVGFSDYLQSIVSNTTGSTIVYHGDMSYTLDNGNICFYEKSKATGSNSYVYLYRYDPTELKPLLKQLIDYLQIDMIEWKSELHILPRTRDKSIYTTLTDSDIISMNTHSVGQSERYSTNRAFVKNAHRSENATYTGKYKTFVNDIIIAKDDHLYNYDSVRTPNWIANNTIDFNYNPGVPPNYDMSAKLNVDDIDETFIKLTSSYLDTSTFKKNNSLSYSFRVGRCKNFDIQVKTNNSSTEVINVKSNLEQVSGVVTNLTSMEFLQISFIQQLTIYPIVSAFYSGSSLFVTFDKVYDELIVGDAINIYNLGTYSGIDTIDTVSINSGRTRVSIIVANYGIPPVSESSKMVVRKSDTVEISDINICVGETDDIEVNYDYVWETSPVRALVTSSDVLTFTNPYILSDQMILDKAMNNYIANDGNSENIIKKIKYKGEINPLLPIYDSPYFYKITSYKRDLIENTSECTLVKY